MNKPNQTSKQWIDHTLDILRVIFLIGISLPSAAMGLSLEAIARIYNGAGPDKFPSWFRAVTTWLLRQFEAAFIPHDLRYFFAMDVPPAMVDAFCAGDYGDARTIEVWPREIREAWCDWEDANEQMLEDMRKIIDHNYPRKNNRAEFWLGGLHWRIRVRSYLDRKAMGAFLACGTMIAFRGYLQQSKVQWMICEGLSDIGEAGEV